MSQPRERETGRYGFDGDFERLCVCGHPLGLHTAEAPHECLAIDAHSIDTERFQRPLPDCDCIRFKRSRGTST